jgi:hypothetical protein
MPIPNMGCSICFCNVRDEIQYLREGSVMISMGDKAVIFAYDLATCILNPKEKLQSLSPFFVIRSRGDNWDFVVGVGRRKRHGVSNFEQGRLGVER